MMSTNPAGMFKRTFCVPIFLMASAGCSVTGDIAEPTNAGLSESRFLSRRDPAIDREAVVIIFNHGTRRPQYRHKCRPGRDVPGILRTMAEKAGWRIYYLCSRAIDGREAGSYTFKRAREIEVVVDRLLARGLPSRRIFLAGFSAGAWSSLIAARGFGHKFNAVIAFAPAFAGPRHEEANYPWWRKEIRPHQIAYLRQAKRIDSLVFAFPDDAFNRPEDLRFLKRIRGVTLVPVDHCRAGHRTPYRDCFETAALSRVTAYVKSRLKRRPTVN